MLMNSVVRCRLRCLLLFELFATSKFIDVFFCHDLVSCLLCFDSVCVSSVFSVSPLCFTLPSGCMFVSLCLSVLSQAGQS